MNMSIATPARWATRADGSPPSPEYTAPRSVRAAGPLAAQAPVPATDRVPVLVWVIAAVFVAAELAISNRYGFLQDELYFIQAGRHLAFGYVDQPPLAPLLTRITGVLGVSPAAVRIVPALAGGVVVVLAARFAALFGAGRFGRVLAALATACAPTVYALAHLGITEPLDLLAWAVVLLCVTTALLRDRPRWWLGAGVAAGIGLEDNNLMLLLLIGLAIGLLCSGHRAVVRTQWPWLAAVIAAVIWAPNVIWQAAHGWPELAMASALHQQNTSLAYYIAGVPMQLAYAGLLAIPLVIAGIIRLWRAGELRFLAITATLLIVYVAAWVPGKVYYSEGMAPAVLAAGAVAAERWAARGRKPALRRVLAAGACLLSMAISLATVLPVVPVADLHSVVGLDTVTTADTVGWPQLTRAVAGQDAALARAGQAPTSIFTGNYGEAGALDVLGTADHLPPVLSGQNNFWIWGPGQASDRTVLVVDALGWLRPYFARCRVLTTYHAPYHVQNDFTGLQIGVCTGPSAGWRALWPHLKHYD
jgi:4-amino-4-deoxy-L-arabinose transferase-like glycosyltransferase